MGRQHVDKSLEIALSVLLSLMVINVLWQGTSRYIFNDPSSFTDELARYMLIWLGLLGSAYASGKHMHVAIELLDRKLTDGQIRKKQVFINAGIFLFALVVLIIGGIRLVYISFHLGQTSSAMQLSLGYVYLALPLSGLLICYYALLDILQPNQLTHGKY